MSLLLLHLFSRPPFPLPAGLCVCLCGCVCLSVCLAFLTVLGVLVISCCGLRTSSISLLSYSRLLLRQILAVETFARSTVMLPSSVYLLLMLVVLSVSSHICFHLQCLRSILRQLCVASVAVIVNENAYCVV